MLERGRGADRDAVHQVLVAEDDDDLRRTIELWFESVGDLSLRTVADCEAALAELDGADVFVCDRMMPGLSGPEVIERVETTEDVPIVVMSAYGPDEHLDGDDVERYLCKPLRREDLAGAIREVLAEE